EDAHDVRARDPARVAHLADEALVHGRIAGVLGPHDLDGDLLLVRQRLGQVDRAHSALPERLDDLIAVAEHLPDHRVVAPRRERGPVARAGAQRRIAVRGAALGADPDLERRCHHSVGPFYETGRQLDTMTRRALAGSRVPRPFAAARLLRAGVRRPARARAAP